MSQRRGLLSIIAAVVVVLTVAGDRWSATGNTSAQDATPPSSLEIALNDATGAEVGTASFSEGSDGLVSMTVSVQGLPPGEHGIHVHAVGACEGASAEPFGSAGPHYNPSGAAHGGPPSGAPGTPGALDAHGGDYGNLTVREDGTGELEIGTDRFTLATGPASVFDSDGSSLLIHAMRDDLTTDPAGNTGERIACGVIAPMSPEPPATPVTVTGHTVSPAQRPFDEGMLGQLQVPDGFEVSVVTMGAGNVRMMAVGPDGTIYVTRPESNDVIALSDADGDGMTEEVSVVASNLKLVHGITIRQNRIYLAGEKHVWVADLLPDGTLGALEMLVDDLPDGAQHGRRTIGFGPDGMLYISIGSSCNACDETNMEHATILRANADGTGRTVFAKGLRNTIGFGWHPETGVLWGMDHGSDWRGDDQPPEELNRIEEGGNYGWPFCYGAQEVDQTLSNPPTGASPREYCGLSKAPALTYQAHSAPIGMAYYDGAQFPSDYQGDAFVAMRGSWNREPATGYKVVRVHFENGEPTAIDDFVTGWLLDGGSEHFGRIAGVAVAPDGSLLISEDTNGVIYRVSYTGA